MAAAAAAAAGGPVHDAYGFAVKAELQELYSRFAPIFAAEEAERCERWEEYVRELRSQLPSLAENQQEDDAQLLARALAHLGASTHTGQAPPPQAAALLQRLSSLVQAGLPMAKRGTFWRLFLNVEGKRQAGEYGRLVREVAELERELADGAAVDAMAKPKTLGQGLYSPPLGAGGNGGAVVDLVVDASSGAAIGAAASATAVHRVDIFSITRLDYDSPECTPTKPTADEAGVDEAGTTAGPGAGAAAGEAETEAGTPISAPPRRMVACSATASLSLASAESPSSEAASSLASSYSSTTSSSPACASPASVASTGSGRWRQQDFLAQIDKDLHRTFPGHPCMDANGRAMLRRILGAYARRNATVGYCQGLNFLAATFMLFLGEEDAFWCLCAVIEDLLGPAYFDERMVAPQVDVLVFGHLLQGGFPTLWRHLQALEVDAASVCLHWFLCCFLNSLPLESTLRVWDILFFAGSPVVLFRVALALIEIYQEALMCTRESSDAYMLLQCCAQMTYDASRLVDTACIGYSHLMPAGLRVLRQRYRPLVVDSLRCVYVSDDDEEEGDEGNSSRPHVAPGSGSPFCFHATFRRLSSAVLEAEEAAAAQRQAGAAGSGSTSGDSGHFTSALASRPASTSSRHSSPGSLNSSAGSGSRPVSPLDRMRQAVSGLTARLVPSALPVLLPAGAMDASGQELLPLNTSVAGRAAAAAQQAGGSFRSAVARRLSTSAAEQPAGAGTADGSQAGAGGRHLRCISVGKPDGAGSPTAALSRSALSGAALGRQAQGLTPFSGEEAFLEGPPLPAPQQQQQQQQQPGPEQPCQQDEPAAAASLTPRQAVALASHGAVASLPAAVHSQPATPVDHMGPPALPPSHRRAFTAFPASHTSAAGARGRRRSRRLPIDFQYLADWRPDFHQPAVAAAFAIAANPSPRAATPVGGSGSSSRLALGRSAPAVSALGIGAGRVLLAACSSSGSRHSSESAAGNGSGGADELQMPIRTLNFGDAASDGAPDSSGGTEDCEGPNACPDGSVRRAVSAPPAALLASVLAASDSEGQELPSGLLPPLPAERTSSEAASIAAAAGLTTLCQKRRSTAEAVGQGVLQSQASKTAAAEVEEAALLQTTSGSSCGTVGVSSSSSSVDGVRTSARCPPPLASSAPLQSAVASDQHSQQQQQLLAVVAHLQDEVTLAESRRHDAEQAARQAQQMAADLRQQLGKVLSQVAAKEALVAELSGRVEASAAAVVQMSQELAAKQAAIDVERKLAGQRQRELAAADALIGRLMDAVAKAGRAGSASGGSAVHSGSSSTTSSSSTSGTTSSSSISS